MFNLANILKDPDDNAEIYYPGKKKNDISTTAGTGACPLEHTRACSCACVAVNFFLSRAVLDTIRSAVKEKGVL